MLIDHKYKVDISQPMVPRYLPEPLFYSDQYADRFVISLVDGMQPISAASVVIGYFIREEEGETVVLSDCGIIDGKIYVVLDPACYAKPGRCAIVIQSNYSGAKKTVFYGHTKVVPSMTDIYVDPGYVIGDISDLINKAETLYSELEQTYESFIDFSNELNMIIDQANDQISQLADTSIHHYIQREEPTGLLRNGDLWTYKELTTWGGIASDELTWDDLGENTWGQLVNAGSTGYTKTYLNGMWLLMSSVSVDSMPSAENENF